MTSRHSEETRTRVIAPLDGASIAADTVLAVVEAESIAHVISVGSHDLDFTVIRLEPLDELVVEVHDANR